MKILLATCLVTAVFLAGCDGDDSDNDSASSSSTTTRASLRTTAVSSDGVNISILESGNPAGPALLFVHGFSQAAQTWNEQLDSDLADDYRLIAMDLRGHGSSGKPEDPNSYVSSELWADDIQAVADAKGLDSFTLVGWSYGGLSMLDYVQTYGQDQLDAMIFVATGFNLDFRPPEEGGPAEATLGPGVVLNTGGMAGVADPGDPDGCDAAGTCGEYSRQLAATRNFLAMVPVTPLPEDIADEALAYNLQAPPYVRGAMVFDRFFIGGPLDHIPTLQTITVPALFIHGDSDQHVLPRSTEIMQETIDATGNITERLVYENIGHAPFLEDIERFNADVDNFVSNL